MGTALSRLHTQASPSTGARPVCGHLLGTNPVFPAPKGLRAPAGRCVLTPCSYLCMHACLTIPLRLCVNPYPCQARFRCLVPNEAQLRGI